MSSMYPEYILLRHPHQYTYMLILLYLVSQDTEYILRHPHQYTCQVCIPGYQVHIKTSPPVYKHVNPVILSIPGYQVHAMTSPPVYMSSMYPNIPSTY